MEKSLCQDVMEYSEFVEKIKKMPTPITIPMLRWRSTPKKRSLAEG